MIARLTKSSGVSVLVAGLLTLIGYLLATRNPNQFQDAFQNNWEIIAAGLLLVVFGLLEMGRGVVLGFSVVGAFQNHNLTRSAGSLLVGTGISALGATLLYNVLFG
jgi:hypothetical protein